LRGTFDWHIDGTLDDVPHLAAVSTAVVITEADGGTEFANTAAAFASFGEQEQARLSRLRVVHGHASHQRRVHPDPTPEQEARWAAFPTHEHPLVWRHPDGRRSLLIGATAERIVGMAPEQSTALLDDLLVRATRPEFVYRHDWTEGDLVIWDNQALLHRACPYAFTSPRELHRTHIGGDTPPSP
jgi:alpha-ketoglutarate-dependent taurine dioxygenase